MKRWQQLCAAAAGTALHLEPWRMVGDYAGSLLHGSVDDGQRLDEPSWVRERRDRTCNSGLGRNALRKPLVSPQYPIFFTAPAEIRFPATEFEAGGTRENLRYSENAAERGNTNGFSG